MDPEVRQCEASRIEAILFDKDGTLFDFRRTWLPFLFDGAEAIAEGNDELKDRLVRAAGYDPDTDRFAAGGPIAAGNALDLALAWGRVLSEADGRAGGSAAGAAERAGHEEHLVREIRRRSAQWGRAGDVPVTDLPVLFSRLRGAGITLGLATSDTTEAAREALERHHVAEFFSYVVGYDGPAGAKPAAGVAKAFYEPMQLPSSQVMVVGDTWHDMRMARSCGCLAVAVLTGAVEREVLAPHADIVLESIAELPAVLGV